MPLVATTSIFFFQCSSVVQVSHRRDALIRKVKSDCSAHVTIVKVKELKHNCNEENEELRYKNFSKCQSNSNILIVMVIVILINLLYLQIMIYNLW